MAHDMEVTARWFVGGPAADGVMAGERQWRDVDVAGIRLFVRRACRMGWLPVTQRRVALSTLSPSQWRASMPRSWR